MCASSTGKRYVDVPGVKITLANIPVGLQPLLGLAKEWAIVGDDALEEAIRKAGKKRIRACVDAAWPLKDEMFQFAYESNGAKATPVPDEVVVFQMFAWSLNRLEVEVR
jgi:hypothetical protein